jgi:hypothetical protein
VARSSDALLAAACCWVLLLCSVLLTTPSARDNVRISPMGGKNQLVSSTLTSCNLQQGGSRHMTRKFISNFMCTYMVPGVPASAHYSPHTPRHAAKAKRSNDPKRPLTFP